MDMQTLLALEANPIVGACSGLGLADILALCSKADPFAFHPGIGSGFQAACSRTDPEAPLILRALLERGEPPAMFEFDPFEAAAASAPNLLALLDAGLLPPPGSGALSRAACIDNVESLRVLLGPAGMAPNHASRSGERALAIAARHGSLACLQALLEAGADPLAQAIAGDSLLPLHYAARMSQSKAIELLIPHGGLAIESREGLPFEVAALHCMGAHGKEAFEMLLSATDETLAASKAPGAIAQIAEHLSNRPLGRRGEHWLWQHFEYAHRRLHQFLASREARQLDAAALRGSRQDSLAARL